MQVNAPLILQLLQQRLPNLLAVYAFGSQVDGNATPSSDVDLAVLVEGYVDVVDLWDISGDLADAIHCDVDLLDFRAASTVMQFQILSKGQRWFAIDSRVACYEATVLSAMTALNEARADLLAAIGQQGVVYGSGQSSPVDDVLINKAATIERFIKRARDEYAKDPTSFSRDFTRQDAAILNIQRACEAALDIGQHLIRLHKLGIPQSSRDVFTLLATAGFISTELAEHLKKMVGFRNIAVHEYQRQQVPITEHIMKHRLTDFSDYVAALLTRTNGVGGT